MCFYKGGRVLLFASVLPAIKKDVQELSPPYHISTLKVDDIQRNLKLHSTCLQASESYALLDGHSYDDGSEGECSALYSDDSLEEYK